MFILSHYILGKVTPTICIFYSEIGAPFSRLLFIVYWELNQPVGWNIFVYIFSQPLINGSLIVSSFNQYQGRAVSKYNSFTQLIQELRSVVGNNCLSINTRV